MNSFTIDKLSKLCYEKLAHDTSINLNFDVRIEQN